MVFLNSNNKLCLVSAYFGAFPWWFNYFIKSVEANPSFNWLLISDNQRPKEIPKNIEYLHLSLHDLKRKFSKKLNLELTINHPYKLCDFKPAYGKIFEQELKAYRYWGYCDIDVVFGDMQKFLAQPIDESYDIISPESSFFPGHLCIFKNSDKLRNLFLLASNYKEVFSSSHCFLFDEFYYKNGFELNTEAIDKLIREKVRKHKWQTGIRKLKFIKKLTPIIRLLLSFFYSSNKKLLDFNAVIQAEISKGNLTAYKQSMCLSDVWLYRNEQAGWRVFLKESLIYNNKEYLYFHFQLAKKNKLFIINNTKVGVELKLPKEATKS